MRVLSRTGMGYICEIVILVAGAWILYLRKVCMGKAKVWNSCV